MDCNCNGILDITKPIILYMSCKVYNYMLTVKLSNVRKSKFLRLSTKMKIFNSIIFSVLKYGSEVGSAHELYKIN